MEDLQIMTTGTIKKEMINMILDLADPEKLKEAEASLRKIWEEEFRLKTLQKPLKKKLDLEVLKVSQGFQPVDKARMFGSLDSLEIAENLEELLGSIDE